MKVLTIEETEIVAGGAVLCCPILTYIFTGNCDRSTTSDGTQTDASAA